MILTARELLGALGEFNRSLPDITLRLLHHQDGGLLPVEGLRDLGKALANLSKSCYDLADDHERETSTPVLVIDASTVP